MSKKGTIAHRREMEARKERRGLLSPGFTPQWSRKVVTTGKTLVGHKQPRLDAPTKPLSELRRSKRCQNCWTYSALFGLRYCDGCDETLCPRCYKEHNAIHFNDSSDESLEALL